MDNRAQRAYNWAFGAVRSQLRMLPFALMKIPDSEEKNPQLSIAMAKLNGDAAHQFDLLYQITGSRVHREAADAMREVETLLQPTADTTLNHFASLVPKALTILESIKARLESESPQQFTNWWVNPFKHYPKKLPG